jgi:DNA polymerase I-like protein with 3'-5' exonuclease and polymerase domains
VLPRPHKNQKKKVAELFPDLSPEDWGDVDWEEHLVALQEAGIKITTYKKESINKKALHEVVEAVCEENEIPLERTDKGAISASSDFIKILAPHDKIIWEYQQRQELARLVGAELPKLDADRVHPNYHILKNTGRTSSTGAPRGKEPLYPSTNIQQVDPRARCVFVPDEGHVICSVDYSSLELVSLAQATYNLLGYSVHRDKLLKGYDMHSYLGSQLALNLHDGFAKEAADMNPDEAYQFFKDKEASDPEFYGHWRKFAKPVGLGFPGGLGADTFVTFAAGVYDVVVTHAEAQELKEIWLDTYPEMVDYFDWVNKYAKDPEDPLAYCYESPMGMWRARASYCATANGKGLQTPAAEGAKIAIFKVFCACNTPGDLLYGTRPWGFIHDEIDANVLDDELAGKKADRIAEIMVDSMQMVFPDVPVGAEPALMRRWDKRAKEVRDEDGNLLVWEPKE